MSMKLHRTLNNKVSIELDDTLFCSLKSELYLAGEILNPKRIEIMHSGCRYMYENACITDEIEQISPGILKVCRQWELQRKGEYSLVSKFSNAIDKVNNLMIPGIWYDGNLQGKGSFPSEKNGECWSFFETRMSVPCCMQLRTSEGFFTCATTPSETDTTIASCNRMGNTITIDIPGNEIPQSYRGKQNILDTSSLLPKTLSVDEVPCIYERIFYISADYQSNSPYQAYSKYIKHISQFSPTMHMPISWKNFGTYKFTRLLNLIRKSPDGKAYVLMGEGNGDLQQYYNYTAASFLVKSLEASYLLLKEQNIVVTYSSDYVQARASLADRFSMANDENLMSGIATLLADNFLAYEILPGVHQDCVDIMTGEFGGYLGIGEHDEFKSYVNARCNGESMKYYVLVYSELKKRGLEKPEYIALAKRVAKFYCKNQLENGSFGRWWTVEGIAKNSEGTNGAHVAVFFLALLKEIKQDDPLRPLLINACEKAYDYYSGLAEKGYFFGDTLDADSFDKEAGVVLMDFFLDLYEFSPEKIYLESAQKAADFLLTWIWQFKNYIPPESPLGRRNFSTKGMTSVSVAHNHLDFYGIAIAYDFFRFAEYSGDRFYFDQGQLMANACRQLISMPEDRLGRDPYFSGWQPEQINHTSWDYFNSEERMNGNFYIDIAWVAVLGLEGFNNLQGLTSFSDLFD